MKQPLLTLLLAGTSLAAGAQNFSPLYMRGLPMDFPGLNSTYNQILVDANFAASGAPNWGQVETITVTRNTQGVITGTDLQSTYPVPIVRATATQSGNVYTALVEIKRPAGYRPYERQTVWTNGTLDTASQAETYDTVSSIYVNADRWSNTYDAGNRLVQTLHYRWNSGAWAAYEKRLFTYLGATTQYATDSTFLLSGGSWKPSQYNVYTYSGNRADSVTYYKRPSATFQPTDAYKLLTGPSGMTDTIYAYTFSGGTTPKLSSRSIFRSGPAAVYTPKEALGFMVYPNPATDYLTLRKEAAAPAVVQILDAAGRCVARQDCTAAEERMSLEGLLPGIYLVVAITKDAVYRQPLIVQKK